jgi:putative ABC transport system permease protein
MTVIGVSGCTALLVAGFGLRDSIKDIGTLQFEELFEHELEIELEEDFPLGDINKIIEGHPEMTETLEVFLDRGYIKYKGESIETTLVAVEEIENISGYVVFRDRKNDEIIEPQGDKIVISEKVAEVLGIEEGDTVVYENFDEKKSKVKIDAITENYLGNYVYMNKSIYEEAFSLKEEINSIYIKTEKMTEDEKDNLIKKIYQKDGVLNAEFISDRRGLFDNLITSINYIVGVIIVASGMLAFIVLYNLTNININERRRELATLKVLGFHNEEVSSYIFREITILSIVGTFVGLLLGKYLHLFIVLTVENPNFMFGRDISLLSYILSGVITLIFSVVVDLFMVKKLRNIKMVDSLKAND